MKNIAWMLGILLFAGCASTGGNVKKVVIWETANLPRTYDVIGPVSVVEQVSEKTEDMIQGIAGMISKDGRVSDQVPPEIKAALEAKKELYKERIFDKLAEKAKPYDADAVISAEYNYVPAFASFSSKAMLTAKGTMVRYK